MTHYMYLDHYYCTRCRDTDGGRHAWHRIEDCHSIRGIHRCPRCGHYVRMQPRDMRAKRKLQAMRIQHGIQRTMHRLFNGGGD